MFSADSVCHVYERKTKLELRGRCSLWSLRPGDDKQRFYGLSNSHETPGCIKESSTRLEVEGSVITSCVREEREEPDGIGTC